MTARIDAVTGQETISDFTATGMPITYPMSGSKSTLLESGITNKTDWTSFQFLADGRDLDNSTCPVGGGKETWGILS